MINVEFCMGIHFHSYFCSNALLVGTHFSVLLRFQNLCSEKMQEK